MTEVDQARALRRKGGSLSMASVGEERMWGRWVRDQNRESPMAVKGMVSAKRGQEKAKRSWVSGERV